MNTIFFDQTAQTARAQVRRRLRMGVPVLLAFLGSLIVVGALSATPAYPVKQGPTGRYLVDQQGVPFLIAGESPQAMIGDLSEADAELFFQNRLAHGFNTVWINLLCNGYTGCNADGTTFDGIAPFTTPGDLSTPNETYFARADRILQLAAQYGFLVILDPAETGGWLNVLVSNGVAKCRAYGQFLGQRYKDFDNILWMHGNDYQDYGPTNDPYVTAVALGIQDRDTRHIHTVELNYNVSGSLDAAAWAPLLDLNASYTYYPTYQQVLADYNRSHFLPTFMVEASYEFEQNAPFIRLGTPQVLRNQEYWSILSGATGQLYGNHYTWQFINGWKDQLDTPGAVQMAYVTALFAPRAWYELVPDQAHTVVTAGYGTFGEVDYVTAARTPNGTLVMAYVPSARTVTVDMSTLSGPVTARWYDPVVGTFTNIAGSPFANTGSRNLTTPGNNAGGPDNEDWVLVLEVLGDLTPATHARLLGDFNGDGTADILWRHTSGAVYEWLLNGTTVIGRGTPGKASTDWAVVGVGDFNGDGTADILWRHTSGTLYIWLLNGTTVIGAGTPGKASTDWAVVGVGDFNGDGTADILWRHTSGAVYEWLLNGTTVIGRGAPGKASTDWAVVGVGDFNGDGTADILWRHTSGTVYEWLLNGTTVIGGGSPGENSTDWTVVGVGDFNGDGTADILWRHTSGAVYEWLLNGTTVIGGGSPGENSTDWTVVGVGDFNGDGTADILWRHTSGTVYEWLLNGISIIGQGSPGGASTDWQIQ